MVLKTVNLTREAEVDFNRLKDLNPEFNFSAFVQEALKDAMTIEVDEEVLKYKINSFENDKKSNDLKINHYKKLLVNAKNNKEKYVEEKRIRKIEGLKVLKRLISTNLSDEELYKKAIVWGKMLKEDPIDLLNEARQETIVNND